MRHSIQPDYHDITIIMTNGSSIQTRSTYGKKGSILKLDVDPYTHPAWKPGLHKLIESSGQLNKFRTRFNDFGLN